MESHTESNELYRSGDDGSGLAIRQCPIPGPSSRAEQVFHDIHIAGNARTHIGNVYNSTTYAKHDQSDLNDAKEQSLVAALQFDGISDRLLSISPACTSTCRWFTRTQEYRMWYNASWRGTHNGVLWIKGKAGTGKSTLMRYLHDRTQRISKRRKAIAFFFNGRSNKVLAKSVEGMYRSLLCQLYDSVPRLKIAAARRVSVAKSQTWSVAILENLLREAVLGLALDEDVVCYIDALDECPTKEVRLAIECFETLSQSATRKHIPFLLCLSSRYYPHITMRVHLESRLDAQPQHLHDITEYLDDCLTLPPAIRCELQVEIEKRCSGIFLWVVLVVRILKESFDRGATRPELRRVLHSLPRELHELFAQMCETADAEFTTAMRWVLLAKDLLHPIDLYFAVRAGSAKLISARWNEDEVDDETAKNYILQVSQGLIECVQYHPLVAGDVQFVHESVREYLLSGGLARLDRVSEQDAVAKSHEKMAKECQHYIRLCIHGEEDMLDWRQNPGKQTGRELPLSIAGIFPLSLYAMSNVLGHFQAAYLNDPANFDNVDFSLSDYIAVRELLGHVRPGLVMYVPNHSATLLTVLIERRCFVLAEYILQSAAWRKGGMQKTMKRRPLQAAGSTPSGIDVSTSCGGEWGGPMQAAVHHDNLHLVQLLLERGASLTPSLEGCPNIAIVHYPSPLMLALEHAEKDMIRLLLDNGAPVNRPELSDGLRPLHAVLIVEHQENKISRTEKVQLLLSYGADVNLLPCANAYGFHQRLTAIGLAAWAHNGHNGTELLCAIIEAGADVNAVSINDDTALIIAARHGRLELVNMLLSHGANAEYRSKNHGTAIAAAKRSIVRPFLYQVRLRALKGKDGFLPLAPQAQLPMPNALKPLRIPAPTRPYSQRAVRPLQYRQPPRNQRLYYVDFEGNHDDVPDGSEGFGHDQENEFNIRDWDDDDEDDDWETVGDGSDPNSDGILDRDYESSEDLDTDLDTDLESEGSSSGSRFRGRTHRRESRLKSDQRNRFIKRVVDYTRAHPWGG